jgi:4-hydroxybenzoate polyprenyltransferase
LLEKIKIISNLVVLPHSVFALPFALSSLLAASHGHPPLRTVFWVVACMVLARTAAMAYNRLVDADIDAKNPRTRDRDLPAGRIKSWQVKILVVVCGFGFVGACSFLNPLAFKLSPLALAVVFFYSHTKRFTWTSHLFLGLALGVAPVGAWIAATGSLALDPFWLTGAVVCFLAGFDILYATQDLEFDKTEGLHSWVTRWGLPASLKASRFFHAGMLGFLAGFGVVEGFSGLYNAGIGILAAILVYQHKKIYALESVSGGGNRFTLSPALLALNGWIAVFYLIIVGAALWF